MHFKINLTQLVFQVVKTNLSYHEVDYMKYQINENKRIINLLIKDTNFDKLIIQEELYIY